MLYQFVRGVLLGFLRPYTRLLVEGKERVPRAGAFRFGVHETPHSRSCYIPSASQPFRGYGGLASQQPLP